MSDERKQILGMLADGKITADEADRLLAALETGDPKPETPAEPVEGVRKPKFLHIKVESGPEGHHRQENVDIKIPIMLLKAGMKLTSIMPKKARGKFVSHLGDKGLGIDLDQLDGENINSLVTALAASSIDIDADDEKVRIYCS